MLTEINLPQKVKHFMIPLARQGSQSGQVHKDKQNGSYLRKADELSELRYRVQEQAGKQECSMGIKLRS